MRPAVKKIPLSKAGLTVVERTLRSSTPRDASNVQGASAPTSTAGVGSAVADLQAEKEEEAAQGLSHMRWEVIPPRWGLGTKAASSLRPSFMLRRSDG